MRTSNASEAVDISLRLEPAVGIDGLILGRLLRMPRAERQQWLHGLLTQGFLIDCEARRAQEESPPPDVEAVAPQAMRTEQASLVPRGTTFSEEKVGPTDATQEMSASPVSLTDLRRMIS